MKHEGEPVPGFYVVLTQPHVGMEQEYHEWYNARHIPDILAVPGVEFARRFELKEQRPSGQDAPFAALYGFSDTVAAVREIMSRRGTDLLRSSPTVDRAKNRACVFSSPLQPVTQLCAEDDIDIVLLSTDPASASPEGVIAAPAGPVQASDAGARYAGIYLHSSRLRGVLGTLSPSARSAAYSAKAISKVFKSR